MSFGSQFATPVKYIKAGFDRIIIGTNIPNKVRKQLYAKYRDANRAGSPRAEEAAFKECVTENFDWPWFDKHKAQFEKHGLKPYMWRESPYDAYKEPSTVGELLAQLLVKDLREVAKELIPGRKLARTRDEIVAMLSELTFENLRSARAAHEKISALIEKDADRLSDPNFDLGFKLGLLSHSVTMAVYAESRMDRISELDKGIMVGRYEVIVPIAGCPVERQVARQFNLGLLDGTPPFFPGDRSMITQRSSAKMKECGFTAETYRRKPLG